MKQINIACHPVGIANVTTPDVHISDENLASKIVLDFSEMEGYELTEKWLDIVMSNGTSLRYNMGTGFIVELEMSNAVTVSGYTYFTPFIYDGSTKIKFKTDSAVNIYRQVEAGSEAAVQRDDFIFDLAARVDQLDGEGLGSKGFLFDINNPKTSEELAIGEMAWDLIHKTVQLRLSESVYLQFGQENPVPFLNKTGVEIPEGIPVYVSGVLGASHNVLISPLSNDNYENCKRFVGVTTEPIPHDSAGFVAMFGEGHDISAGDIGDVIYVGHYVLTNVEPIPPLSKVVVGLQGQTDPQAILYIKTDIRKNLDDLNNVYMPNLAIGDTPEYDGEKFIKHPAKWTDLNFPLTRKQQNPTTQKPDYDSINMGLLFPQNNTNEYVDIIVQMPHGWKEGSNVNPHVHVVQSENQQAVFKYDYIWYNVGDPIPTNWVTITMNQYAIAYVSGNLAQIIEAPEMLDGTGKKISSIMKIRLYRDDNVYSGDILTDQFDIHYQLDARGSLGEYIK